MRGSIKWLVFGAAVMLFGTACGDDEAWAQVDSVSAADGAVTINYTYDVGIGFLQGGDRVGVEFCAYPDLADCFIEYPGDATLEGDGAASVSLPWSEEGDWMVSIVVTNADGEVTFVSEAEARFSYTAPDVEEETAPAESTTTTAAPTTTAAATTTTSSTTTTSTTSSTSTTSTTVQTAGSTTTAAPTATTSPTTTAATTSTTSTSTTSSTTTTTIFDYNSTTTTQPVVGVGEWMSNDMTTCAYRGTMGCGIYRTQYSWFPDYGPVGGPGDMMPDYWGSPGEIAYSTYSGHAYGECDNNGEGGCGWYYTSTRDTYELGSPIPSAP